MARTIPKLGGASIRFEHARAPMGIDRGSTMECTRTAHDAETVDDEHALRQRLTGCWSRTAASAAL
jgi:hypothetical protein